MPVSKPPYFSTIIFMGRTTQLEQINRSFHQSSILRVSTVYGYFMLMQRTVTILHVQ